MSKGTLSFTLPEEEDEFRSAQEGSSWKYLMLDILAHLRSEIKHSDTKGDKLKSARLAAFEEIQTLIWNSIEDRKLKAD